ncbi:hypothetical protein BY996DRAFT_6610469 [Phakopsora pachyrhizi]|nr:hypothetical protein BY996DRAFT_6610469 [Phakopsora pachyrhizi]
MEARQAFIEGILGRRAIAPVFQLRADRVAPEYGMFIHDEENNQIWFNPASTEFEEFKLIGKLERELRGQLTYDCQQEQRSSHEYVSGMKTIIRIRIIIFSPTNLNRSKPTNSSLKPGLNFLDSESSFYDQTVLTSGISRYPSTQSPVHPDVKTWLRLSGIPGNDDYQEKTLFDKDKSDPTKTNAIFKRLVGVVESKKSLFGQFLDLPKDRSESYRASGRFLEGAEEERVFEEMVLKEMKYLNLVQGIHEFLICDEDLGQVQLACRLFNPILHMEIKKNMSSSGDFGLELLCAKFGSIRYDECDGGPNLFVINKFSPRIQAIQHCHLYRASVLKKNLVTRDQDFIKRSVDKTEHELEEAPKKEVGVVENHRKKSSEVDLASTLVLAEVGLMIISPMGIGAVPTSLPAIRKVNREKVKTTIDYTISKDDGGGKHSTQRDSVKKDKGRLSNEICPYRAIDGASEVFNLPMRVMEYDNGGRRWATGSAPDDWNLTVNAPSGHTSFWSSWRAWVSKDTTP